MAGVNRQSGTVKWFDREKGFGFITPDTGGEDIFVHQTCIQSDWYRNLSEGEVVEFIVEQCYDGRTKAIDVTGPEGAKISDVGFIRGGFRGGWGSGRGEWFGSGGAGGGGGGRGPGAGSAGTCYTCGVVGHVARFCQENGASGRSAGGCYSCGQPGHFARECPNSNGARN